MKFPTAILFDLDDTLFDHTHASRVALASLHARFAPQLPFQKFADEHARVLEKYHLRFLAGDFTLDEARTARMLELFSGFAIKLKHDEADDIATHYREQHQANRMLLPGALALLEALRGRVRLGIITNNSVSEQHEKLRHLDIAHYFDTVVISQDVGITKPDPRIFQIALERLGVSATDALMIGDSLEADIIGAQRASIGALWLNRENNKTPANTGLFSKKSPRNRMDAGLWHRYQIKSLAPLDATLAAIEQAFSNTH